MARWALCLTCERRDVARRNMPQWGILGQKHQRKSPHVHIYYLSDSNANIAWAVSRPEF